MPAAVQRLYVPGLQWKRLGGITGAQPEIVRQYRSASMGKVQRQAETTCPPAPAGGNRMSTAESCRDCKLVMSRRDKLYKRGFGG